ncbi:hypothetical protein DPMN_119688 [Dreissena polymorpha]|uniref:Uncharacterized protein n=1 Tax=Dreissena polymorpha TaxID=45954 RepID=A0A9D4JS54_DREPO|nr:hypothetical protein DPMN_119688 [Dreissena polymorpha]
MVIHRGSDEAVGDGTLALQHGHLHGADGRTCGRHYPCTAGRAQVFRSRSQARASHSAGFV